MTRFFLERAVARKTTYAAILVVWLVLMLRNGVELKEVVFMGAFFLVCAIVLYYFIGFGVALFLFFTNKLGIYQLIYWCGLVMSIRCLFTMAAPHYEREETELMVFVGLAISLGARSIYFNCKNLNKKKN